MSRLARKPILKNKDVQVAVEDGRISVKGPKGQSSVKLLPGTEIKVEGDSILVEASGAAGANLGTMWSNLKNAVEGAAENFTKILEIEGVGYRAAVEGKTVVLNLGFSHPIRYELPAGVTGTVEKNVITLTGADKQTVGQAAADIRDFRKPEPYKGKGIHYRGEVIRRKVGKKAAATTAG